jgi:hypothetical protein
MTESRPIEIPFSYRILFCFSPWAVALLGAYFLLGEDGFNLFLLFPLGLPIIIPVEEIEPLTVIGWVIYGVLTCLTLFLRNRSRFHIVFSILVIVLLVNVVGCRVLFGVPPPIVP